MAHKDPAWFAVGRTQELEVCDDAAVFDSRAMIESTMIPRIRTSHLQLEAPTPAHTRQMRAVREILEHGSAPEPKPNPTSRWLALGALLIAVAAIAILL